MLQPKLTSRTVDIHPAVAFGSVIVGTALLGAVGALIAIPAVATLQAFLGAYVKRYAVTDDPRVQGHRRARPVATTRAWWSGVRQRPAPGAESGAAGRGAAGSSAVAGGPTAGGGPTDGEPTVPGQGVDADGDSDAGSTGRPGGSSS